ncbi:TIGR01777 family oxidoreductase [Lihuaxuella thermophila]|uniref:TIGR01777 family protein n=1 Tax=Lihuaxuella thermophila TaxID=1173111 RepID=A0A1H8HGT5_9BACL|nr:TIGR01777 family oxidoreductase [Lihuaxuella thermophila]SEN55127.1 hypothetical protein SAMN05444955_11416 [Lihuaxuella thermophila]
MRIAMTGATGLVGTELAEKLSANGHQITNVTRGQKGEKGFDPVVRWNPERDEIDPEGLEGHEVVIHLAGENIASGRWTERKKKRILSSRVEGTALLCQTLARLKQRPKVLLSASAIGYYGLHPADVDLDETSPAGDDFLARVCVEWEKATQVAKEAGIRVVNMRFGMILSRKGGAMAKMLPAFRLGAGGKIGDGKQIISWVALDEIPPIIEHLMKEESISGPVNVVSPRPVSNEMFTSLLGEVLHRPAFIPLPARVARMLFGEMADALLLGGSRVLPRRLLDSGYRFAYADLKETLQHLLQK